MKSEYDGMIAKLLHAYKDDTSIAEARDVTIAILFKTKSLAMKDLHQGETKINTETTTAMNRIKDIKTNTLLEISNQKTTTIQEFQDIRYGTSADMANLQNILNSAVTTHLNAVSLKIETEMKETLLAYVTNHTIELHEIGHPSTNKDRYIL